MTAAGANADQHVVDQLEEVWRRIAALGAELDEAEWKLPTDVPGWTVQDNLTHLTDIEAMLLDRPRGEHTIRGDLAHVKNDMGRRNEVFVDARRAWPGAEALAEFRDVTDARVAALRACTTDDFDAASWTPMGPGTVRDLLPFRAFDSWVHEQDMRRAVGRPGGWTGPAAEASMARIVGFAGFVVGKSVGPPDGTVVVVELAAPLARTFAIEVVDGRARPAGSIPDHVDARVVTDGETYVRLSTGRVDPAAAFASGAVRVVGDESLGRRVVESLNVLF